MRSHASNSRRDRVGSTLFLLVWTLGWTCIVGGIDVQAGRCLVRQLYSSTFRAAPGNVIESRVDRQCGRRGTTYRLVIAYSYQVKGRDYIGRQWNYTALASSDHWAHKVARAHRPGTPIGVFFDPRNPSEAVIEPGLTGTEPLVLMFLIPFNLIMVGSWALLIRCLRVDDWRTASGVRVTDDGHVLRVRLPQWSPLLTSAALLFIGCILAALLIALVSGCHPPLWFPAIVWVVILLTTAVICAVMLRQLRNGRSDLVLDRFRGSLELPATHGRKVKHIVATAQIVSIEAEVERRSGGKKSVSPNYFTTLGWVDDADTLHTARLMRWGTPTEAEDFTAWLRQQVAAAPLLTATA